MKRILLAWFLFLIAAQTMNALAAPSVVGISTAYPLLQTSVRFGGVNYSPGSVAYGPVGTPFLITGANFGSSGIVSFIGTQNTTTATVPYTSSDGATIWLSIPAGATTGSFVVSVKYLVSGSMVRYLGGNSVPILVTTGTYSANCPGLATTPTVSLVASPSSISVGGLASFSATFSGGFSPTGTVKFEIDGTMIGIANLTNGVAYIASTGNWVPGTHTISAIYSGDSYNNGSTATTRETVNAATPTVSLVASPSSIPVGGLAKLSATINGGYSPSGSSPTGTVTFEINGGTIGTASVEGGVAIYSGTNENWVPGTSAISAVYSGDTYNNSATGTTAETVKATVDTGNITLTVNGILSASTNYAGGATASTVAEGLAGGVTANSPVNVTAVNDALFLEAKQPGSASNYAYTLQTSSYDTQDFSSSSFLNPAISGNLQGGADQSSSGNAVVYSYTVPAGGYDGDGNLLNYTDWVMGTWTFSYDSLNRLVGGSDNQSGNSNGYYCWGYDPFGNRTVQTGSTQLFQVGSPTCQAPSNASTTITWANYNTNNQFTNTSRGVGYDSAGNVTNDGVNQYLYDGEGRVCAVLNQPFTGLTVMTGYIYGANGKRVAKGSITTMNCDPTINGFTPANDYVLGLGGEQLTEMGMDSNGSMAWEHTNVYAAGTLLATYDQNGLHFHLTDPLGTRRTQTDYAGVLEQTCSSLPFGDSLSCTGSIQFPTEHHFTGKERDSETGLDYFGARYNASNMGRFMSPDPGQDSGFEHMDDPQSWNGYAYARNNPLTVTDPDGRNYVVCDGAGKNCANLSDSQYDEYRKQNQNQTVTASGAIYQNNDDGSSTKVGQATYYNEKDDQAAQMLANTGRQLSDPRTIGAFYGASALLGAGASASPLIGGTGASLTTLSIPMGLQPGAVVGGFILTEHAVEQAMERGVTLSEIVEAVSGVAKSNPQNGWDSVQRFYTSTCEVRVNMVTGTIVTVINKIQR